MTCYLLIISNLILKLLIAIYFVVDLFFFQFHPLEFDLIFILILIFIFMIVICFSIIIFLIKISLSIKFDPHSFDCYLFYLK